MSSVLALMRERAWGAMVFAMVLAGVEGGGVIVRAVRNGCVGLVLGLVGVGCLAPGARAADQITQIVKRTGFPYLVQSHQTSDAFASCQPGEQLVGGGAVGEGVSGLLVSAPDPNNVLGWFARAYDHGVYPTNLTAYAFCASAGGSDQITQIVERAGPPVLLQHAQVGDAFASCQPGEQVVGGGAVGEGGAPRGDELFASAPDPNNALRWFARASNQDTNPQNLTAYAYCASAGGPDRVASIVERAGTPVLVQNYQTGDAVASCQPGEQLVGGGAVGEGAPSGDQLLVSAPEPNNALRWLARAFDYDSTNHNLTAYAFCASAASSQPPSSVFSFGELKRNKKGTATLIVNLPGPGTISLSGPGLQTISKHVGGAGPFALTVIPKGKTKKKLKRKHKASVKVSVTFTPTGGLANTQSENVKLIKKR